MKKYKGKLATKLLTLNKNKFSEECLKDIKKSQVVPVTFNFNGDPIGHTTSIETNDDGELICHFNINLEQLEKYMYVVPSGIVDPKDITIESDGTKTIHKMKLLSVSITDFPADSYLTSIESLEKE